MPCAEAEVSLSRSVSLSGRTLADLLFQPERELCRNNRISGDFKLPLISVLHFFGVLPPTRWLRVKYQLHIAPPHISRLSTSGLYTSTPLHTDPPPHLSTPPHLHTSTPPHRHTSTATPPLPHTFTQIHLNRSMDQSPPLLLPPLSGEAHCDRLFLQGEPDLL